MFGFNGVTNLLAFALVFSVIVRLIYSLIVKNWNYFSDRNVVFERGLPMIGTIMGNYRAILGMKSMADSFQELYNRHPERKFVGMYEFGGKPSYLIRDLDLIRKITITDFDCFVNHGSKIHKNNDPIIGQTLFSMVDQPWRDMRSTISPLFTGSKIRHMLTFINECVNDFNEYIRNDILLKSKTNSLEYDMMNLMLRLANDIIGSTSFGIRINTLEEPENEFYKIGQEIWETALGLKGFIMIGFPKLSALLKLRIITDRHESFFRKLIHSTLQERKKQKIVRKDMLHLLMLGKEGKLNEEKDKEADQNAGFATVAEFLNSKALEKLKNWTDVDLVPQCVNFFVAGFIDVATAFCLLCYELGHNPDIQERLYEEIVESKEQLNGKPLTFETLQRMKYMDMVVSEILRKWPNGTFLNRAVSKQYLLEQNDGSKVLLEPNDVVVIPKFALHRDPKLYPNPEVFDPERFSDENRKNLHPCAFIPFGSGPRNCIASRFALLQLKAVIYHILLDFKVESSPKTPDPMKLKGRSMALEPEGGFFNQLTLRN